MNFSKIKTLIFYANYTSKFSYYDDWLDAFLSAAEFDCKAVNTCRIQPNALKNEIADYELIVLLHSATGDTPGYIAPFKDVLNRRRGKLLVFVGNEVNLHGILISEKIKLIQDIGAEFIGTQLPVEAGRWLYEDCKKSVVVALPHALNTNIFRPAIPHAYRKIDIGTRSFRYLPYIGDNERERLFNYFLANKFDPPLNIDIDTNPAHRFNRSEWADFLNNCKGTIATEAGSYYLEKDDRTFQAIREYVIKKQKKNGIRIAIRVDSKIQTIYESLPAVLKQLIRKMYFSMSGVLGIRHEYEFDFVKNVTFEEIYDRFFKELRRPPVNTKAISSRHFDAIGTKTCQIMFRGKFNDILKADEHYIAIEHDFSNMDDVIERFRDLSYRQSLVDRTFEYIISCHTYRHRVNNIRELVGNCVKINFVANR